MAQKSSVGENSAYSFIFTMGGVAATVALGIVQARIMGPAGKALVGYAAVGLSMTTVFFNGLSEAVGYQYGRKKLPAARVHAATLVIAGCAVPLVAILLTAIALTVPSQRVLIAAACAFPFALYAQLTIPFFMIRDRVISANIQQLFSSLGYAVVAGIALLAFRVDVPIVLAIWVGMTAVSAGFAFVRLVPMLRRAGEEERATGSAAPDPGLREAVVDQLRFAWKAGFASVATYINLRIDVVIVSLTLPARLLGIYTLAIAMGELMWKIAQSITWSALGRIASDSPDQAALLVAKITRSIFLLQGTGGLIAFIIGPWALTFVYGSQFAEAGTVLRLLLPGLVLYTLEGSIGYFLMIHEGKALTRVAVQLSSIVVCASVTLLTVHRFSIEGAAIATTLSYLCVIGYMAVLFSRTTGVPLREIFVPHRADVVRIAQVARKTAGRLARVLPGNLGLKVTALLGLGDHS